MSDDEKIPAEKAIEIIKGETGKLSDKDLIEGQAIMEMLKKAALKLEGPGSSRIGKTKGDKSPNKKSRKRSSKSRMINYKHAQKKRKPSGKNHRSK